MNHAADMPGQRPKMATAEATLTDLLGELQRRFYAQADQSLFYRDRCALARALTWPALWLDRRGVQCSQDRYRALLVARLEAIQVHGDSGKYGAFFPAYLLKCLQDWFTWHGEDLYLELKHARNAIEVALLSVGFDDDNDDRGRTPRSHRGDPDSILALATLHKVLRAKKAPREDRAGRNQIMLNLS